MRLTAERDDTGERRGKCVTVVAQQTAVLDQVLLRLGWSVIPAPLNGGIDSFAHQVEIDVAEERTRD